MLLQLYKSHGFSIILHISVYQLSTFHSRPKVFAAGVQCITSAFGIEPRRMLRIIQRFGKHCNFHLQDEAEVTHVDVLSLVIYLTLCVRLQRQD
jgi:hypothetical protein